VLAAERARAGWTQKQLALRAGTTQALQSRIETGRATPSLRNLFKTVEALGLQLTLVLSRGGQAVAVLPMAADRVTASAGVLPEDG
jgi:transcriptional regulator with XRE-family HTH domain